MRRGHRGGTCAPARSCGALAIFLKLSLGEGDVEVVALVGRLDKAAKEQLGRLAYLFNARNRGDHRVAAFLALTLAGLLHHIGELSLRRMTPFARGASS